MIRFFILILCLFFFLLFALGGGDLSAQSKPSTQGSGAIHIQSNSMEVLDPSGKIIFMGNVAAKREDLIINADRLEVFYAKGSKDMKKEDATKRAIEKLVAEGHVRITTGKRIATGEKAIYDKKAEIITITGSAQAWEGLNRIKGETILLFINEDRSVVKGSSNKKVEAIVYPDE